MEERGCQNLPFQRGNLRPERERKVLMVASFPSAASGKILGIRLGQGGSGGGKVLGLSSQFRIKSPMGSHNLSLPSRVRLGLCKPGLLQRIEQARRKNPSGS